MEKVIIWTTNVSPRLRYICEVIFDDFLETGFVINPEASLDSSHIQIVYGDDTIRNSAISIPSSGLLERTDIVALDIDIDIDTRSKLPIFSFSLKANVPNTQHTLPCDIFALTFFFLTRYEEYADQKRDRHGRYLSHQSISSKYSLLDLPIVDLWIKELCMIINSKYKTRLQLIQKEESRITIDIDLPYAFKYKRWRKYAGFLRDMVRFDISTAKERANCIILDEDPFDTYQYIKRLCAVSDVRPQFFILNRYNRPLDDNHIAGRRELADLIKELDGWADIGIHPSITAGSDHQQIAEEISYIDQHKQGSTTASRQHFLVLGIPHTYRALIRCGIKDDYSMGYPDALGFRAGTARSFRWYDLEQEESTQLIIHPCILMDVTLRYYLKKKPAEAIRLYNQFKSICATVNGTCATIWHNSNLSAAYGWSPWKDVFEHIVASK